MPILSDEPEAVYHARSEVSNSKLSKMEKSALNYWAHFVSPDRIEPDFTPSMQTGLLLHTLILEPHNLGNRFHFIPSDMRRGTKAYQAETEIAGDRFILKEKDREEAKRMADAVYNHKEAMRLIDGCDYRECTVLWQDEQTGIDCRGRIDLLSVSKGYLADIKTTKDASMRDFNKSIYNYGYDRQCAMYKDGLAAQEGLEQAIHYPMFWICVEPTAPYHVAVYGDSEGTGPAGAAAWEDIGRVRYQELLAKLKRCLDTNEWPGYSDQIELIQPPAWAIERLVGTPVGG